MPEINLGENIWNKFVSVARKNRKNPERLAERVLRDYLARLSDEELLAKTIAATQYKGITIAKAENAIRKLRGKARS